ncbi:PocR ligand-binding domain-containing protein [Paramagnetospirillum magnetotacticum]|nr:PocR ligand-binding domain-containing protein [Paramagnetospirillum magnetotacticum]
MAVVAVAAAYVWREIKEGDRHSLLQSEAHRHGIGIMSQTLNGNLMGSVAVTGLLDEEVKQEALGRGTPNGPRLQGMLEGIAKAYDAHGAFVVGRDGVVRSSWDSSGKPSTGLDVTFRPYYRMAMQRKENVYAAVSLARGDRSLYFTAPILSDKTRGGTAIGGVVARTDLSKIDALLRDKSDISLLLSPQGVVFAASRSDWIGYLSETPSPQQLASIRELKQFGNMFENKEPSVLPFSVREDRVLQDGWRYAVASAQVQWNDPFGDWTLVLMEDLSRTVPRGDIAARGGAAGLIVGVLILALLNMLRSRHEQEISARQVAAFAAAQQVTAERKAQLAATALRFQQAKTVSELADAFLREAHRLIGVLQGVVYIKADGGEEIFRLVARYAASDAVRSEIALGEGLLGQCAEERRTRLISTPSDGIWSIESGLGNAHPSAVVMVPAMLNDVLHGVVEVALLHHPDEATIRQLEEMVNILALNLELVRRHESTEAQLEAASLAERVKDEQLAFQQVLVDAIPYPVFYLDAETRFLGANRAYEEAFGVRKPQLIGHRMIELDIWPEADRAAFQSENEAVIAAMGRSQREVRIPHSDGTTRDALYFLSGFCDAGEAPGGLVGAFIDISAMKNAERELARLADADRFAHLARGRENRILELKREVNALAKDAGRPEPYGTEMVEPVGDHEWAPHPDYEGGNGAAARPLKLDEMIDLGEFQSLFSSFCEVAGVPAAIIDLQGNVLSASRWQPACTDFHRVNSDSCARCIESDTELALKLQDGEDFTMYRCKNGMTDCASPIIVEGRHLANVFIGQFHVGAPDQAFFRNQARQFGYDEAEYMKAVLSAPVMDEARLPVILGFLSGFARMISTMSLARLRADAAQEAVSRQAALLRQERLAAMSLAEDAARRQGGDGDSSGEAPR